MYVIAVYDIGEQRVNKIYKILKRYLFWRQRSVFEGEIDVSLLNKLKEVLSLKINKEKDSIIFFEFKQSYYSLTQMGIAKIFPDENIVM